MSNNIFPVENYFPAREDDSPFQSDENLVYMRKLSGKCRHGVMPCEKIVSCYAIALVSTTHLCYSVQFYIISFSFLPSCF